MTSVTIKTFPTPELTDLDFAIVTLADSPSASSTFDLIAYFLSQFPSLSGQGLSGYTFLFNNFTNPFDGGATRVSGVAGTLALQDTQDPNAMLGVISPMVAHINKTWPGFALIPNTSTYGSFWDWYQVHYDQSSAGTDSYVGSRLLDGPALTANLTATAEAFRQFTAEGAGTAYLVSGKGVWDAQPRGGSNAVLPAWRKAYVHASKFFPVSWYCPFAQHGSSGRE